MVSPSGAASPLSPLTCPVCQAPAAGKFCSSCGAPLPGAACAACGAPLSPGAKFCHRCGSPAHAGPLGGAREQRSFAAALPWTVAAIALVALVALVAGQRFSRGSSADERTSGSASGAGAATSPGQSDVAGQPPDISNLSPAEAAVRLYNRVIGAHERGQQDTVRIFAPMAIAAYQMIGNLDLDQRYDVGRIGAISGDSTLARAQADSILARSPTHLLGLILAANAAHLRRDSVAERQYQQRLVAAAPSERQKQLPEYVTHENDITFALDQAKRP
jgi:hypothetical protein